MLPIGISAHTSLLAGIHFNKNGLRLPKRSFANLAANASFRASGVCSILAI
jgi:hypothetical protein